MSNNDNTTNRPIPDRKPRPMIDLLISIIIPSAILLKLSGADDLGASGALIVALAFPLCWGMFELFKYKKFNFIVLFGLLSVLLTGGIGLLKLDPQWLAVKEATIPGLIGIAVLISTYTRYPLIKTLLYNPCVINTAKIQQKLDEYGIKEIFEKRLQNATYWLSATFLISAILNYMLAKWVVTSPAGSAAFNEELGQMTLLSYPVIAVPSTIMLMAIFYFLWRTIHGMTGLTLEEILVTNSSKDS